MASPPRVYWVSPYLNEDPSLGFSVRYLPVFPRFVSCMFGIFGDLSLGFPSVWTVRGGQRSNLADSISWFHVI
jgi:hypothetical protein